MIIMDSRRVAQIATIKEQLLSKPAVFRAGAAAKGVAIFFLSLSALLIGATAWGHYVNGFPLNRTDLMVDFGSSIASILLYLCLATYKLTIADGWITTQYLWITRRTKADDILKWNFGGKYNGQAYIFELKNGKTIQIPGIQDRPRDFERILHAIAKGRGSS
jgi:hypothetical protein